MIRVPEAKSDCSRRGEAEVRILNFKTTWSEFHTWEFHHLPRVGPKQFDVPKHVNPKLLCASAQLPKCPKLLCVSVELRCTHEAGTSFTKGDIIFVKTIFVHLLCFLWHLNNYFDFHFCLSFRPFVRPSGSVQSKTKFNTCKRIAKCH